MGHTAQVHGLTRIDGWGRRRSRVRPVESQPASSSTHDLWDRHGGPAYVLACALLGDEKAAQEVVRLAMSDLARGGVAGEGEARRRLARTIYRHAQEAAGDAPAGDGLPPAMVWLSRLARLQRASLALCVYGGLTHREAAALLEVPVDVVAERITAGLRELRRLAAEDAGGTGGTGVRPALARASAPHRGHGAT